MKISVVIATYNGEKYIDEQLKSIINQSRKPDEIIICDDASNDNTLNICESVLKDSDIGFTIIKNQINNGILKNFNKLMDIATGDIIFLCDQDDLWYNNKIERFLATFNEFPNKKVVFSNADIVDSELKSLGKTLWDVLAFEYDSNNLHFVKDMLSRNIFTGMCMAIKKDWYNQIPVFSNYMLHDEFIGWCAAFDDVAIPLNECLVAYRQHNNNVVGSGRHRRFESFKEMKKQVIHSCEKSKNKFSELITLYSNHLQADCLNNAYSFYCLREHMLKAKMPFSIWLLIKIIKSNGYRLFCSKSDKTLLKDVICLFITPND